MHFHSVSKLHVYDVKLKGKMESICQCITLLHVLHLKSDTLTEILQSHYTHFTLKSLQCVPKISLVFPKIDSIFQTGAFSQGRERWGERN